MSPNSRGKFAEPRLVPDAAEKKAVQPPEVGKSNTADDAAKTPTVNDIQEKLATLSRSRGIKYNTPLLIVLQP